MNIISSIHPAPVLPQRRKRRRINPKIEKTEDSNVIDQVHRVLQIISDLNDSYSSSSDRVTSSRSQIQEVDCMDGLSRSLEDIFELEKLKHVQDFPSIEDINAVFGISNDQQCCIITPTISALNFCF